MELREITWKAPGPVGGRALMPEARDPPRLSVIVRIPRRVSKRPRIEP